MKLKMIFILLTSSLTSFFSTKIVSADGNQNYHNNMMNGSDFGGFSMIMMGMMGFSLLISVIFAYIVYEDAIKNNISNAPLWGILVFFTSIFGLIIYFVWRRTYIMPINNIPGDERRSQEKKTAFCRNCGSKLDDNSKFCSDCGTQT